MATLAPTRQSIFRGSHRFYLISALVMAGINVVAFAFANAMGRSSFGAPLIVHAHALVFFGWVTIYVAQNVLASSGQLHLHRKLGWIAAGWMVAMVLLGTIVTVRMVRGGHAPFFFQPGYFLIMNPVGVLTFAGLSSWAIVLRRRTEWHKRLHFCGMAMLMGPSLGRLLPAPFLIPYVGPSLFAVMLLFPLAGVVADLRRTGRVHPAWAWGIAVMVAAQLLIQVTPSTPIGLAIYSAATAGSPGEALLPLAYPPFPPL
ncbi:hypothetical protein [Sphingomonas aerophila]|jgi:hypothetical protein|uniref:Uncharacterized protein n=1 Tax=Sphingomonas aerophila TaxID=1344948 RepID=A0A7W9BFI4_9SPHN|nr:hypothetical protein [Sphingomonas aerophila]MBB5715931.1 hypothetical protein [Sphingomonas aerophila]